MPTILSWGLGVESTSILVRWILEPETRPCDLSDLLVVTAMTGSEHRDTKLYAEEFVLPLMRQHNIRYVQVARHGPKEADGITVLSDTRQPNCVYTEGDYKLSDELFAAGCVPSFAGIHRCSLKSKAWVIEGWLASEFEKSTFTGIVYHAFGYNAEETSRVRKSDEAFAVRHVAFGFNAEEIKRVDRAKSFDTAVRVGFYPLVEWGWTRQQCIDYLQGVFGARASRSSCVFCPFCSINDDVLARHRNHPDQVAEALLLEFVSLAMNPRGTLYRDRSLREVTEAAGHEEILAIFEERRQAQQHAVYRVRRIYNAKSNPDRTLNIEKKGTVQRAVERMTDPLPLPEAMQAWEREAAISGTVEIQRGISYLYRERCGDTYPTREEFLVVAPAVVDTKARYGIQRFDEQWDSPQQTLFPIIAA